MSIYKSQKGRDKSLELYDRQLSKLGKSFSDIYVKTSFGKTHIIETGNSKGIPLLVFHGGNSTSAYNLLMCQFLLEDFHIYAVDIIGHPGKSDEVCLSHRGYSYGKWASEVIDKLGYDKIACFGGSFGGGVLAKLICISPKKVRKAVLVVPAGISNALPVSSLKMMIPLLQYRITKKKKYLIRTALYMALHEAVIDEDTLDIVKDSFDNVKTKVGMPTNIEAKKLSDYYSPTLVIASERDCLFPAKKVLPRAKRIIPDCSVYELKDSGHMHVLPQSVKNMIIDFLK
ncbi:alpha/beta fold hydrolase [Extibacter muris]|uniref:alpha/beta fold hydrolase n=1 Tax=Extibacter muris TaxID=1796622 RepID=UPI001D072BEE|nr:alpha/beta hydrolase [Extibacter muris]MCB6203104.1 alpha/beta hydrolase [Extibacter muris]MCQ4664329.1 alpha/beta hydrolase [Extibacter muris]MCQ4692333.1 alpha/beta hydrolase [Extibacter muris]MCQ4692422.1 alpha/beta hydrolase [Extibacter muris]